MDEPPSNRLKTVVADLIPESALEWYRRKRYGKSWFSPRDRSVSNVFTQIYKRGVWGKTDSDQPFNSGPGSDDEVSAPYIAAVHKFIDEHSITSVVDLGCGDFRVGRKLVRPDFHYRGLDVVQPLVDYNNQNFGSEMVKFQQANLITDTLPPAQLCFIRQVLQHLSNAQVASILTKAKQYRYLVITEHLPSATAPFTPNLDIEHGNETRVDIGSGLVFDAAPFNLTIDRTLCEVTLSDQTRLRTVLIVNPA